MALIVEDRVRDTSTTTGTGTITVTGTAPIRYRAFASVCAVSDTFPYAIVHQTLDEWEVGIGTLASSTTFTRTTVLSSSNAGAAVSFTAGTKDVIMVDPARTLPLRTITGTANQIIVTNGDGVSGDPTISLATPLVTAPTIQKFTSSSGTYTTPAGVKWIRVRMVGGGAGGFGSGTAVGTSPTAGGNTTFGTTLLVANGGAIGNFSQGHGGAGGTASLGTGPVGYAVQGGDGGGAGSNTTNILYNAGGHGGVSAFGGAAGSDVSGGAPNASYANSGSGGPGAGGTTTANLQSGNGGGAGGFVDAIIAAPSATYSYAVGAAGNAGGAGSGGFAGAAGAAGVIIVEEHYNY